MNIRFYIPVFASTLLLSAALLFSVQPMFSKMVLPMLGGTPQVWNTAMLFFQATLLLGYAYAHGTSRFLSIRTQAIVHVAILLVCVVFLPLAIPEGSVPPAESDPTLWQLGLMAASIGGPFFVISGSAPMLQRWFAATPHPDAHNPYFLYGASNLGSMASLLSYPFIIDPLMGLGKQSLSWSIGYGVLILFTVVAAALVFKAKSSSAEADTDAAKKEASKDSITWKRRFTWLFWAFIPSSMMLGVTTYITTDIASAPLLWIVPLAIYVGSFIIVFARKRIFSDLLITHMLFLGLCTILLFTIALLNSVSNPFILIGAHFGFFFIAAVACHQRLADLRPSAANLTEFYLLMSVGGVLGGFFNAIIAPQFFLGPIEYSIAIALAVLARYSWDEKQSFQNGLQGLKAYLGRNPFKVVMDERNVMPALIIGIALLIYTLHQPLMSLILGVIIIVMLVDSYDKRWVSAPLIIFLIFLFPPASARLLSQDVLLHQERNFFGVIRVVDIQGRTRTLLHGTTNHGVQALADEHKLVPLSYYGYDSPNGDIMKIFDAQSGEQKFAVLGLGSGATACYSKPGRKFDFFEIDPAIARISQDTKYFTFLSDCGSPYEIILGDGRLTMNQQDDAKYDFILIDAFSSDSIPIHLITKDATAMYMTKLKEDGILLFHISNRHLDLEPVLSKIAEALEVPSFGKVSLGNKYKDTELDTYPTQYVALTKSADKIEAMKELGWDETKQVDDIKLWTDNYSNILSAFGSKIINERMKKLSDEKKAAEEAEKKANLDALKITE